MDSFVKEIQVRWSDLDPNAHLRHSVYYDWGAFCRVTFLVEHGLTTELMQRLKIGPILFREECVFRRELRLGDKVRIDMQLKKAKRDYSRWTITHTITKNDDVISATITVDGAWLDVVARKLAQSPPEVSTVFDAIPRTSDFEWLD